MLAYQLLPGDNIDGLQCVDLPRRALAPGEVRVRVHAVSLNYRDLMVAGGSYLVAVDDPIVPCSDGAPCRAPQCCCLARAACRCSACNFGKVGIAVGN